jgi:hypothetical protein
VKRPVSIYLGVLLILLRAVTTADRAAISSAVLVALMAFFVVAVIVDLVVAVLIVRGSNRARFAAMILSTIMVVGSAIDFFADGTSFTLENGGLLGLSLDILVLVALSDSDARDFTTGNSNSRRAARRSRRAARRLARRRVPQASARSAG